jgi:hypothetical protein
MTASVRGKIMKHVVRGLLLLVTTAAFAFASIEIVAPMLPLPNWTVYLIGVVIMGASAVVSYFLTEWLFRIRRKPT